MKTFKDLEFKQHPSIPNVKRARMDFDNGYGVSVITGVGKYSGVKTSYELAALKDGEVWLSKEGRTVLGYLNEEEVTEYMKEVQELPEDITSVDSTDTEGRIVYATAKTSKGREIKFTAKVLGVLDLNPYIHVTSSEDEDMEDQIQEFIDNKTKELW